MASKINPEPPLTMPRRNFLRSLVGLFAALWSILALYPIFRYLRPPGGLPSETDVVSVVVGSVGELPVGQGKNFQFGSIPGIVTHTPDDKFHAFNAICTHLGCTVQYRPDMSRIWCACHGGQYDPATGEVLAGPPPRPLEELQVSVQEGKIIVSQG